MTIIRITDSIISEAVNRLNRVYGGEHDITLGRDGMGRPYASIRYYWKSGAVNPMYDRYEYDADEVAEFLGIDGEAFAWCDGGDGEFALARFDTCTERDMWLNQF
jgi:hypothetical protein